MVDMASATVIFAYLLLVTVAFISWNQIRPVHKKWTGTRGKWRLPSGPHGVPILGNMLQFLAARNTGKLEPYLETLASYGDLTTLHMGSHLWILLNNDRVIKDIIVKDSKHTNERPFMPIAGELVSQSKRAVIQKDAEWKEGRRVMHYLLSGSNLSTYNQYQDFESVQLLKAYLREPQRWYSHHFRYSTAILHRVVMGEPLNKSQKELDDYQQVTMEFLISLYKSPIDFFPALAKLPTFIQFWRPKWKAMGDFHREVFQKWWDPVCAAVRDGSAGPSFVRDVLLNASSGSKFVDDDERAMYLATSIMAAGGDNTRMTLNVFVMAAIRYPLVFARARKEVDEVCSTSEVTGLRMRLPCMEDMAHMPYICAVIKEVLRWRPTVPLIPPHQLTRDLEYDGYHFPKGTNFLINNTALCRSFEEPDTFKPERWLGSDETEVNLTHAFWGFGGGRRVCVGHRVEQQILFIALSRLIYCFDFLSDENSPKPSLNNWSLLAPFPVSIRKRGNDYGQLIEEEAMIAKIS